MAGPREKQGLDYFMHDVDLSSDEKVQLLEADHGLIGYGIFCKLLEKIYRNGYFLKADEKVIKLLSKAYNIEINVCINVINVCINEGLFDKKIFKNFSILTSKGIQTRYCEATKRRKNVEFIKEFLLINVNGNDQNVNIISINADINKQRRGEERRGEREESKKKGLSPLPSDFSLTKPMTEYASSKGMDSPTIKNEFEGFILHHKKKGSKFVDWDAAWQTWCRNWVEFGAKKFTPKVPAPIPEKQKAGPCENCGKPAVDFRFNVGFCAGCLPEEIKKAAEARKDFMAVGFLKDIPELPDADFEARKAELKCQSLIFNQNEGENEKPY